MPALGRHLVLELYRCNARVDSPQAIREAMLEAVEAVGATLLNLHVHRFSPQGVTGLAVLAESHFAVHTWPEHGYLGADIFTCGDRCRPEDVLPVLRRWFEPQSEEVRWLDRGNRAVSTASEPLATQ